MIPAIYFAPEESGDYVVTFPPAEAEPAKKPAPVICPEVWNSKPVDSELAMASVRAMCGGAR